MKKAVVFLISIAIILGFLSLFSLLLPSNILIASQANVIAPVDRLKTQVNHFDHWKNWYDAFADSAVTKKYLTPDSSVVELLDGNKAITLTKIPVSADTLHVELKSSSASNVLYEFVFIDREGINSNIILNTYVHLKWYPWEKVKGLFMHKMLESFYADMVEKIKLAAERG